MEDVLKKLKSMTRRFKGEDIPLYIMALPGVALLILFSYLPMGGLVLAFKKYNVQKGIFGSPFNGLDNFKFLFATSDAFIITRNTVLYNIVFIFLNMVIAVILSLMLSSLRSGRLAKAFQTIYMMPYFLSWAVVAIIAAAFLERSNGYVNHILQMFGQEGLVDWYQKISIWPPLLVFINAWKGVGYQAVMYLAVISGISSDYYEAAMLDGASRLQQAVYITIPHLRFIIAVSLIMAMGGIFRGDFGLFYTVTKDSGTLYPVTNVIDTYIYRGLKNQVNLGMTTAAGLFQSVVGFVFVLLANRIVSKVDPDSAMF
jgi:putative aldouronate transport system permease protein